MVQGGLKKRLRACTELQTAKLVPVLKYVLVTTPVHRTSSSRTRILLLVVLISLPTVDRINNTINHFVFRRCVCLLPSTATMAVTQQSDSTRTTFDILSEQGSCRQANKNDKANTLVCGTRLIRNLAQSSMISSL